jgi:hypothetical protein
MVCVLLVILMPGRTGQKCELLKAGDQDRRAQSLWLSEGLHQSERLFGEQAVGGRV